MEARKEKLVTLTSEEVRDLESANYRPIKCIKPRRQKSLRRD